MKQNLYKKSLTAASLKLKIIQNNCDNCTLTRCPILDSPPIEAYMTPNTTIDSTVDSNELYSTPLSDISAFKMKSLTNLANISLNQSGEGAMTRMMSLGSLDSSAIAHERSFGETPIDLMKTKFKFEKSRFPNARIQSLSNIFVNYEENVEYRDARNIHVQRASLHSWNVHTQNTNGLAMNLEKRYDQIDKDDDVFLPLNGNKGNVNKSNGKANGSKNEKAFKKPPQLRILRKEKSSSSIETARGRHTFSSLYDKHR